VVAGAIVFLVAVKLLRRLILALVARTPHPSRAADTGTQQPEQIHLISAPAHAWQNGGTVVAFCTQLTALGFADAGVYSIAEIKEVFVWLHVLRDKRLAACIYEHPQAGTRIDFFCQYKDGRSLTYTTAKSTGVEHRPGDKTVHATDLSAEGLYRRLLNERSEGELEELTPANIVTHYQNAYARTLAWRKSQAVAAEESSRQVTDPAPKARTSQKPTGPAFGATP
jgi:hypothetical protein